MEHQEKFKYAQERLKDCKNIIEVGDFRHYLLLALNLDSGGPEALLKHFGLGNKNQLILPYDPTRKRYFTKIMASFSSDHHFMIYIKSEKLSDTFKNKSDSPLCTKYLTEFERKNLLPPKFTLLTPEIIDFTDQIKPSSKSEKIKIGIESLFLNLAEFIMTTNMKYVFLLEGEGDQPDILFALNVMLDGTHVENFTQLFDVYVDEEHKLRDYTFIRMKKEDLSLEYVKEIKDLSHSELFGSHWTIIVPVKSFSS